MFEKLEPDKKNHPQDGKLEVKLEAKNAYHIVEYHQRNTRTNFLPVRFNRCFI